MAGMVKVDGYHIPGSRVLQLLARECPATGAFGEVCLQYDPHSGAIQWCPFMYGLRVHDGGHFEQEYRSTQGTQIALSRVGDDSLMHYTTMCLRKPSQGTRVGAVLKP